MKTYLGVDGGGTKTEFVLIDANGRLLARHQEGSAYYLETGLDALEAMLARGIRALLDPATSPPAFAFFGLPAYGEDRRLLSRLSAIASPTLAQETYRCGNDMVCAWAGALGCRDGINIVAGTGSIAYGEFAGRAVRTGGWGELFSDEGSAYWVAREALNLFSRMSDGRAPLGPLHELLCSHFKLTEDLDLCAAIYGQSSASRSQLASLAEVVAEAARRGDTQVREIFATGARHLAALVHATRRRLGVPAELPLPVSWSGGMFKLVGLVLEPFLSALRASQYPYECLAPRLSPAIGAAVYAAKCGGAPLTESVIAKLELMNR